MNINQQQELANFFSYLAPKYEAHTHCLTLLSDHRWRRFTINCLRLRSGDKVLDLSTGTGQLARLAACHPAAPQVSALDSNSQMLALAARKAKGMNITFMQGDARHTPFADNTFKAITMGFGLRIMPQRHLLLQEILRILQPKGRIYFLETAALHGWRRKFLLFLRPHLAHVLQYFNDQLLGYRHLLDSMLEFPQVEDLHQLFISHGFVAPRSHSLTPALAHVHVAEKP